MANKTSKKNKKKKYNTRLEKNKNIYYKNNSSSVKRNNGNKKYLVILAVSIILNSVLLLMVNNRNNSIDELQNKSEEEKQTYEKELETIKDNYTNYLFLGDSITEYYDLDKYFPDMPVVNSGISGNITKEILNDMKNRVYIYNPSKVFLLIGTNDLSRNISIDEISSNIKEIVDEINNNEPQAEIYVESIYPVNYDLNKRMVKNRDNDDIMQINNIIKEYCNDNKCTYINLYDKLTDNVGDFSEKYTDDGLHPNDNGYEIITKELNKYLD